MTETGVLLLRAPAAVQAVVERPQLLLLALPTATERLDIAQVDLTAVAIEA